VRIRSKANNSECASNRQTLYKEFERFFCNFHSPTCHRATSINQENETELFCLTQFCFLGSFFRDNKILGLNLLKCWNKTSQTGILVSERVDLVLELRGKHIFCLVKYLYLALRNILRFLRFNLQTCRCHLRYCIFWGANKSYFVH